MSDKEALQTLGVPGLVVIVVTLATVIIFLYRRNEKLQTEKDTIQNQRIEDAKQTRDKVMEPLEKQALMTERIHELLLNLTNRRGK